MDSSRPQRSISDIRPPRTVDGVTPNGGRTKTAEAAQAKSETSSVSGPPPMEAAPVAAKPAQARSAAPKQKRSVIKSLLRLVAALIILAAVAGAGWLIYVNYFRSS